MDEKAERIKWLNELKTGDKVCVEYSGTMGTSYEITNILKITPTKQFRIGSFLFNSNGERREGWSRFTMIPASDEIRQIIRERNMRHFLKKIDFDTLSTGKIEKMYAIVKEN